MRKTILITGSTDGIGLVTAKMLVSMGHQVLIHGRSAEKVEHVLALLREMNNEAKIEGFIADFSSMNQVKSLAEAVIAKYSKIDVLINNAGVFVANDTVTGDGFELRFAVNTIAPYLLTKLLLPSMDNKSRIVNLSSAAQSPVDIKALATARKMSNDEAYAQSKLALTMWSFQMANDFIKNGDGPLVIAVNPKSFLGSKMLKKAYGLDGHNLSIGGEILCKAALSDEFKNASGKYFDNDKGVFAMPHSDALDEQKRNEVVGCLEKILADFL